MKSPDNLPEASNLQEDPGSKFRAVDDRATSSVERTTARVGGPNELQLQLSDFVKAAAEKGFTPSKLAKLCERIDKAEKKHGLTYDDLESKLDELVTTLEEKNAELKKINTEVAKAAKKKNDLMNRYHLEEQQIQEYADTKNWLFSIGFEIDNLPNMKNCLIALNEQNFDPKVIIDKLNTLTNLESQKSGLEDKLNSLNRDVRAKTKKLKDLEESQKALEATPVEPEPKEQPTDPSMESLKETSTSQLEDTSEKTLSTISDIAKQASLATEDAKKELEATLSELRSSASLLTSELKESLKDIGPQMKNVSQAMEAARALGKYEAILPLFKLTESSQSNKITETEALVALWNVANAFSSWIKDHYPDQELEISDPLDKLLEVLDEEIKGIGLESEQESESNSESGPQAEPEADPGQ